MSRRESPQAVGGERYLNRPQTEPTLLLNELYVSLQGEGPEQGYPTVLVRLTGCNLRCSYCDSAFAFFKGQRVALGEVVRRVTSHGIRRVLVTGGEPMAQAATPALCRALLEAGRAVSIETNGAYDLGCLPGEVLKVVDVKAPASGEGGSFQLPILDELDRKDVLKFVLSSREDYLWAVDFLVRHHLPGAAAVVFSPVWGLLNPAALAEWIAGDRLEVRLQLQLHKVLWGNKRGV